MDFLKSCNICVNTIMLPGSLSKSTYSIHDYPYDKKIERTKLIFIPTEDSAKLCCNFNTPKYIPALLKIAASNSASILCIHFHGNGCDASEVESCAESESYSFMANYLIVEYPKFGIGKGYPSESVIDFIAQIVYKFVVNELGVPTDRIVLIGRSIGTGPVCNLASYMEEIESPAVAVILQSPYTSLRDAAYDLLGCFSFLFLNRWENWKKLCLIKNGKNDIDNSKISKHSRSIELVTCENPLLVQAFISAKPLSHEHVKKTIKLEQRYSNPSSSHVIKCPVLFIHADNDLIIDPHHSQMMHNLRQASGLPSTFYLQKSTDDFKKGHNFFDYKSEVVIPCRDFLNEFVPSLSPFSLDLEKVRIACTVPQEYSSCSSLSDINDINSNYDGGINYLRNRNQKINDEHMDKIIDEDGTKTPGFFEDEYRASNYCRWLLCPCIFSIEAFVSCSLTCSNQLYYSIPNVNPLFQYETKKSRGKDHVNGLRIIQTCLRLESIDYLLREEGPGGDSDESDESDDEIEPVSVKNPMIAFGELPLKEQIETGSNINVMRDTVGIDGSPSPTRITINSPRIVKKDI